MADNAAMAAQDKAAELGIDVPVLQYVYGVAKVQDAFLTD